MQRLIEDVQAVHQFHSGTGARDAVTKQMFALQTALRRLGFESEIYAQHVDPSLRSRIRRFELYEGNENQVLLWHHSMGNEALNELIAVPDRVVTVYHNVTPAEYFHSEDIRYYSSLGLKQLELLARKSEWGIAASNFNRRQMLRAGFVRVEVIPPKFSFEKAIVYSNGAFSPTIDWIFVGRIAGNKRQDDVIKAFAEYVKYFESEAQLYLVGGTTEEQYLDSLKRLVNDLGITASVQFTGLISDSELESLYRHSAAFVCMSEHEGFGVPLLEAMSFEIPVFAYGSSAIPETLGGAGVLLNTKDPKEVACIVRAVVSDSEVKERLLKVQNKRISRFSEFPLERILLKAIQGASGKKPRLEIQIQGPVETSYSLARLNRDLAIALSHNDQYSVSLYATEGPGDYDPDRQLLDGMPLVRQLVENGNNVLYPDVVIRQMWPPRLSDSAGALTFEYFGWEESRIPQDIVDNFNRYCDAIGAMSVFVKASLEESGVTTPVDVVGVGVDIPTVSTVHLKEPELEDLRKCVFLHVSSAFPRKGVDVLLRAFFEAFDAFDDVTLILKTFPNPHNTVGDILIDLQKQFPNPPDVRWIDRDLTETDLATLYSLASCYVHPSRGEGFGLTVAEAMVRGVPVMSVDYSGLADFVNPDTAFVIPWTRTDAASHLSTPDSVWAEPERSALVSLLQKFYNNPGDPQVEEKKRLAKLSIQANHSWNKVGQRWSNMIDRELLRQKRIRIALLSTWNSKCGIAEYSSYLYKQLDEYVDLSVIANVGAEPIDDSAESAIARIWQDRWNGDLGTTIVRIDEIDPEVIHVQFNFGFFELSELAKLITTQKNRRRIVITLHSTQPREISGQFVSLGDIAGQLSSADAIIVHTHRDRDYLSSLGVIRNVHIIPQGIPEVSLVGSRTLANALNLKNKTLIGTFGFLLPHKGMIRLLEALVEVRAIVPDVHLLALSSLHPDNISKEFELMVRDKIHELGLEDSVTLVTEFLADKVVANLLSLCSIVALPYDETLESSSASLHLALSALRPIVTSRIHIFDDFEEFIYRYDGTRAEDLADALLGVMLDSELADELVRKAKSAVVKLRWNKVGASHLELLRSLVLQSGTTT